MMHLIVLFGACLTSIGTYRYCRATLAGRVQPNLVTWVMWALAPLIGVTAEFYSGVTWAAVPVLMAGLGPGTIACVALLHRHNAWALKPLDYACGAFSLLALILWALTKDPDIAILFSILSDGLAVLPTLIKAWTHPRSETALPFALSIISALVAFLAIDTWNFASVAFPLYLVLVNVVVVCTIERRRFWRLLEV